MGVCEKWGNGILMVKSLGRHPFGSLRKKLVDN
jgi:hypothetical protein